MRRETGIEMQFKAHPTNAYLWQSFLPSFFLMLRILNSDLSTDYTDGH